MFNREVFIQDCEEFSIDIEDALADLQFLQEGGDIFYVADSNVISPYVITPNIKSVKDFDLFDFDKLLKPHERYLFQQYILQLLFYGINSMHKYGAPALPTIFLTSYRDELTGLKDYLQRVHTTNFNMLRSYSNEIAQKEDSKNGNWEKVTKILEGINNKAVDAEETQAAVSDEETQALVEFYYNNGGDVILLYESLIPPSEAPSAKLRRLFADKRIVYLEHIFPDFFTSNQFFAKQNYSLESDLAKTLSKEYGRRKTTASTDAHALRILVEVNEWLKINGMKTRIRLITQSLDLLDLSRKKRADGSLKPHLTWNLVSHLRVVALQVPRSEFEMDPNKILEMTSNQLTPLKKSVEDFINKEKSYPLNSSVNEIDVRVKSITQTWQGIKNLIMMRGTSSSIKSDEKQQVQIPPKSIFDKARLLIEILSDTKELRQATDKAITARTKQVAQDFDYLFNVLENITIQAMPHFIYYSNQGIAELAKKYLYLQFQNNQEKKQTIQKKFSKDLNSIIINDNKEYEYEKLLAEANFYSIFGDWKVAITKNSEALVYASMHNLPAIEANFLKSIYLRKYEPTPKNNLGAIEILDRLMKSKPDDPRYIKEKAINIIYLHCFYEDLGDIKQSTIPNTHDAFGLLERVLTLTDPNSSEPDIFFLRLQVYENMLYLHTNLESGKSERAVIEKNVDILEQFVEKYPPKEFGMISMLHVTLAWAKWILNGPNMNEQDQAKLVEELDRALLSLEIDGHQIDAFKKKRDAIENGDYPNITLT